MLHISKFNFKSAEKKSHCFCSRSTMDRAEGGLGEDPEILQGWIFRGTAFLSSQGRQLLRALCQCHHQTQVQLLLLGYLRAGCAAGPICVSRGHSCRLTLLRGDPCWTRLLSIPCSEDLVTRAWDGEHDPLFICLVLSQNVWSVTMGRG